MSFKFGNIETLKRNRTIEGETGTEVGLRNGVTLTLLCASDANPRWKQNGEDFRSELRRLNKANASEERVKAFLATWLPKLFILAMDGMVDTEGDPVAFTLESATAYLLATDDTIPTIQEIVYDTQNFRGARIEAIVEAAKN